VGKLILVISSLLSFAITFAISAVAAYYISAKLIPAGKRNKFYQIIPLYPKREYAIILYAIALILTISFLFLFGGGFLFQMYVSFISMIISSQIVKVIAGLRKESLK
jgi:hypothetical protein